MKYKRRDITAAAGRIVTPDFEYVVDVDQGPDDPGFAVMTRQLINISPAIVGDDAFNDVFDDCFNDLTFSFATPFDIKELIDRIEDLGRNDIDLDYPADCSHVDILVDGSPLKIRVEPYAMTVHTPQRQSPKLLMESFFEVQKHLIGSPVVKAIVDSTAS